MISQPSSSSISIEQTSLVPIPLWIFVRNRDNTIKKKNYKQITITTAQLNQYYDDSFYNLMKAVVEECPSEANVYLLNYGLSSFTHCLMHFQCNIFDDPFKHFNFSVTQWINHPNSINVTDLKVHQVLDPKSYFPNQVPTINLLYGFRYGVPNQYICLIYKIRNKSKKQTEHPLNHLIPPCISLKKRQKEALIQTLGKMWEPSYLLYPRNGEPIQSPRLMKDLPFFKTYRQEELKEERIVTPNNYLEAMCLFLDENKQRIGVGFFVTDCYVITCVHIFYEHTSDSHYIPKYTKFTMRYLVDNKIQDIDIYYNDIKVPVNATKKDVNIGYDLCIIAIPASSISPTSTLRVFPRLLSDGNLDPTTLPYLLNRNLEKESTSTQFLMTIRIEYLNNALKAYSKENRILGFINIHGAYTQETNNGDSGSPLLTKNGIVCLLHRGCGHVFDNKFPQMFVIGASISSQIYGESIVKEHQEIFKQIAKFQLEKDCQILQKECTEDLWCRYDKCVSETFFCPNPLSFAQCNENFSKRVYKAFPDDICTNDHDCMKMILHIVDPLKYHAVTNFIQGYPSSNFPSICAFALNSLQQSFRELGFGINNQEKRYWIYSSPLPKYGDVKAKLIFMLADHSALDTDDSNLMVDESSDEDTASLTKTKQITMYRKVNAIWQHKPKRQDEKLYFQDIEKLYKTATVILVDNQLTSYCK